MQLLQFSHTFRKDVTTPPIYDNQFNFFRKVKLFSELSSLPTAFKYGVPDFINLGTHEILRLPKEVIPAVHEFVSYIFLV